ncbi:winged helix DNA-binding protein [Sulfitobacter sp. M57]|uniref:winged helix DNA-binding protein n=1 Tax=unclassified Sulfitobacter TaxID=196795 RepID=UPI0023E2FA80|nr:MULTISPECIES: winged helix DNA-binding protein [unclassified Sulfitobacter]MDF3415118.1 winged helix DNA-binding protein [Sulfitobacter sp. KE5]MDF3422599.1 winged helix DNA-binding protein [Sulfitobacter sp. KE43]MDF3433664.1 winged helix DNA-binding protein [Sulfitobacter sp. KE42]MDF3459304.1 winged helix DNA-binding protein [Sulfitobacter sp. S74]MDF3463203.1 winged helix DNA-binding protein [Sulfitobacter sp. Ks18]
MPTDQDTQDLNYRWHLSGSETEVACTELEFSLMRCFEAFGRWQTECLASVGDLAASGPENALLHIVRMNDRAKSIKELARLTNRDDIPNIQYSMRKLVSEGLIEKQGSGRTGVTYQATDKGKQITDDYSAVRARLLIEQIKSLPEFDNRLKEAGQTLNILAGIYEEISRIAATHRR